MTSLVLGVPICLLPPNDPDCICHGNWRLIVKEYGPLIGRAYRDNRKNGSNEQWTFFGIVDGGDDYYYGMWRPDRASRLLSCVGSIEGHGYTLIDKDRP